MSLETQDDAALVARVLAGDPSAFNPLISRHRPGAVLLARRMLSDSVDAEDVVQEALLQAFLGLRHLHVAERFSPWLFGIVINLGRMRLRARRNGRLRQDELQNAHVTPSSAQLDASLPPERIYEARVLHRTVLSAIATLPREQQQAVRLHYLDDLPIREISLIVGIPLGTVKSQLHRARDQLRSELERRGMGEPAAGSHKRGETST